MRNRPDKPVFQSGTIVTTLGAIKVRAAIKSPPCFSGISWETGAKGMLLQTGER